MIPQTTMAAAAAAEHQDKEQRQAQRDLRGAQRAPNGRSLQEGYDECEREFNVRSRCFPKWIEDGRLTRSDAKDRLERHAAAMYFLNNLLDSSGGQ